MVFVDEIKGSVKTSARKMRRQPKEQGSTNKITKQLTLIEPSKVDQQRELRGSDEKKYIRKKEVLTERIQVKTSKQLRLLYECSRTLYNLANTYLIKGSHEFVLTKGRSTQKMGKLIQYRVLERELKDAPAYQALPAQTSQQILLLLERNWKSFFEALDDWKVHPENYKGRPQPPNLKEQDAQNLLIFTNQQCMIKGDFLFFPPKVDLPSIKVDPARLGTLQQVRIVPRGVFSIIEIVYKKEVEIPLLSKSQKKRMIAIDIGVRNTVCIVSNCGLRPWILKGGAVKSVNQFYNKQRAKYQTLYKEQGLMGKGIKGQPSRLDRLDKIRNNKIEDLFHKLSRAIIGYCSANTIGTIVLGYNAQWKQNSRMGRVNNQNFQHVPFYRLVEKITYKAELEGIQVVRVNESHTSKCSFLDNEPIEHHETYCGKRGVYRSTKVGGNNKVDHGLFQAADGRVINSDVNGAYNILQKAFPEAIAADGIEGLGLVPYSVTFAELKHLANLKTTQKHSRKLRGADGIEGVSRQIEANGSDENYIS
ncbi:MAG TPA: transposase [Candidatus Deferrimicrobium sp.]|nr:transposase [Candidatus Deferrimicrobium sp.]